MEFLFDSANLDEIEKYSQYFPITGVTSNPSILKGEGRIDFFAHMKKLRSLIGLEKTLHIQVVGERWDDMLAEARTILKYVDERVYIKVPTTEEGLKTMRILKAKGVNVTATAIYSKIQGFLAIAAGADYIAPYYNRMENLDVDSEDTIAAFRRMIDETGAAAKILAASFKSISQVNHALLAGAHAVTVKPAMLHEAFHMAPLQKAAADFRADWASTQGERSICDLV